MSMLSSSISNTGLSLERLFQVLTYVAEKHKYLRRGGFDRLPYVNHLLKVAEALILIGEETDPELIIASLLHDVVEDTEATVEELEMRFGSRAAEIVGELSDDMTLPYADRKQLQVDGAGNLSDAAKKIRIADKASNMRDIVDYPLDWPVEKKQSYIDNAILVVDQIRGVNSKLEDWFDESVIYARNKLIATENH